MQITDEMRNQARAKFETIFTEALENCATIEEAELQIVRASVNAAMGIALQAVLRNVIQEALTHVSAAEADDADGLYLLTVDGQRHRVNGAMLGRFTQ